MLKDVLLQHAEGLNRVTDTLIRISPPDKLGWKPGDPFMTVGQVLHHLADCPNVITWAVRNGFPTPEQLPRLIEEGLKQTADPSAASKRLAENFATARNELTALSDSDLVQRSVTVPFGGSRSIPLGLALLSAIQHQTNHTMQLFSYLKLLGLAVNSDTLYSGKVPEGVRAV